MIGDTDGDVEAGNGRRLPDGADRARPSAHKRSGTAAPDVTAPDLDAAIRLLLAAERVN